MDREVSIPNTVHLGKAIREIRQERGIPSEQLADAAALDRAHLNRAENHGRNFTWGTLGRIAEALEVPISQLVLRAEEIATAHRK